MIITVRVKPGAKVGPKLERLEDGSYVAFIRARAHAGEANAALVELWSEYFRTAKSLITIKSGASSRVKTVEILQVM